MKSGEASTVTVPSLEDLPAPAPSPTTCPDVAPSPGMPGLRVGALAAGGLGLVGLGVGGVFGVVALSKSAEAKPHCERSPCDATGVALREDARSAADVSTIAFVAGGAMLATGIILWIAAPSARARATALALARPGVGIGPTGFTVRGTF